MSEYSSYAALSDRGVLERIGMYVKHHRLKQNKTQQQLADLAGIGRITLVLLEKGKGSNLLSLIQVIRALNLLQVFQNFEVQPEISPLLIAELTYGKRKRASTKKNTRQKPKRSSW